MSAWNIKQSWIQLAFRLLIYKYCMWKETTSRWQQMKAGTASRSALQSQLYLFFFFFQWNHIYNNIYSDDILSFLFTPSINLSKKLEWNTPQFNLNNIYSGFKSGSFGQSVWLPEQTLPMHKINKMFTILQRRKSRHQLRGRTQETASSCSRSLLWQRRGYMFLSSLWLPTSHAKRADE